MQILVRHALEHALDELLRAREGRFGVRVVAAPQHVLDADMVAQLSELKSDRDWRAILDLLGDVKRLT